MLLICGSMFCLCPKQISLAPSFGSSADYSQWGASLVSPRHGFYCEPFQDHTVILTVVDHFSKICQCSGAGLSVCQGRFAFTRVSQRDCVRPWKPVCMQVLLPVGYATLLFDISDSWVDLLPWASFARNTAINSSSGMTPLMASYAFQPVVLPELLSPQDIPDVEDHLCVGSDREVLKYLYATSKAPGQQKTSTCSFVPDRE